jgi:hypothetical protein
MAFTVGTLPFPLLLQELNPDQFTDSSPSGVVSLLVDPASPVQVSTSPAGLSFTAPASTVVTSAPGGMMGDGSAASPIALNADGLPDAVAPDASTTKFLVSSVTSPDGCLMSVADMQAMIVTCAAIAANYTATLTGATEGTELLSPDCNAYKVTLLRSAFGTLIGGIIKTSP